ncbi:hypothetical protein [Mesorhizobium sp. M1348]|uniref:hypothetical protein n=1 Tax=Mesorhizobium sp. M1348 TaxID=2957089 RepID=UPI00333E03E8
MGAKFSARSTGNPADETFGDAVHAWSGHFERSAVFAELDPGDVKLGVPGRKKGMVRGAMPLRPGPRTFINWRCRGAPARLRLHRG